MSQVERLEQTLDASHEAAEERFGELVGKVADGLEIGPAEARETLDAAGKSTDNLKASVARLIERRRHRAAIARAAELAGERADIERQIAKADRQLEAAEERHERAVGPLHARLKEIEQAEHQASMARTALRRDAPEHLKERATALGHQAEAARQKAARSEKRARELEAEAGELDYKAEWHLHDAETTPQKLRGEAVARRAAAETLRGEAERLRAEAERLRSEADGLTGAMLCD